MVSNAGERSAGGRLLGPAADTLPLNVAVLDAEGTVVATNRSWREFAEANGRRARRDAPGADYLAVTEAADDGAAERAAAGLRDVLRGERESFEFEYPCHSADEERWYLMRAVPFRQGGERYVTVAHLEITDRKRRERELERRREEFAELARLNALNRRIRRALEDTSSREEVETAVCRHLTESGLYRAAWIGAREGTATGDPTVVPRTAVGADGSPLREGTDVGVGPAEAALRTGEVRVADVTEEVSLDGDALAAVPLTAGETSYGALVVHAHPGETICEAEREALADFGRSIGRAVQRVHSQRSLAARTAVALDLRIPDTGFVLGELTAELDCELSLERWVSAGDGTTVLYVAVEGTPPGRVREFLRGEPETTGCTVVRDADEAGSSLLEIRVEDAAVLPLDVLTDYGASLTEARAGGGDIDLGVELPPGVGIRTVLEALREVEPTVDLVRKRHVDRPAESVPAVGERIRSRLTPKQEAAIETAYARGYYAWPREITVEELAETFDISGPALHHRLRGAHRTVMSVLLDGEGAGEGP